MTLTTQIAVHEATDFEVLHRWVTDLVKPDGWGERPVDMDIEPGHAHNSLDQGLDALVWTTWSTSEDPLDWAGDDADDEEREWYSRYPECRGVVHLDTPYGSTVRGMNAWQLHTHLIAQVATEFLAPRGLTFAWYDESAGEWHEGVEGLGGLAAHAGPAREWFATRVLPAIAAGLGSES